MRELTNLSGKPDIVVGFTDFARLEGLASSVEKRLPRIAENLLHELSRAKFVEDSEVPGDIVRMQSIVAFEAGTNSQTVVQLVYPGSADISRNRISILTPIGTALLGLGIGQSIGWFANDGQEHRLTVLSVNGPSSPEGDAADQGCGTA